MKKNRQKNPRDRIKRHLVLTKRLWIFFVLGAVISILGLIIGGVYFNIQSITTSSEYTEILPTYISCLLVSKGYGVLKKKGGGGGGGGGG